MGKPTGKRAAATAGARQGGAAPKALSRMALQEHDASIASRSACERQMRDSFEATSPALAKRAKREVKASNCIRCGEAPHVETWFSTAVGSDGVRVPLGDRCKRCVRGYARGLSMDGTFEDVAAMCHDDEDYNEVFESCCRNDDVDAARPFFTDEVLDQDGFELETNWCFVGLTPEQFQARLGKQPKDAGLKLQDLPDPLNNQFKGVLLRDPDRPYVHYKLVHRRQVVKNTVKMDKADHCYSEQGAKTFDHTNQNMDIAAFRSKLRATKTLAEVEKIIEDTKQAADVGEEEEEEEEKCSDDDAEVPEVQTAAAGPSLRATKNSAPKASPAKGTCLVSGAMSSRGGFVRQGSVASLAKGGRSTVDSDDECAGGKVREKWQQNIENVSLFRRLCGEKIGQHVRRLRELADKASADDSMKHEVKQMRDHLKLDSYAEEMNSLEKVLNMDDAEYSIATTRLHEALDEWPPSTQEAMLQRFLRAAATGLPCADEQGVRRLFAMLVPVALSVDGAEKPAGGVAERFDPKAPTLFASDGTARAKVDAFFTHALKYFFEPLMELGAQHELAIQNNIAWALEVLESIDEELDEEWLTAIAKVMSASRALIYVFSCDAPFDYSQDFMDLLAPAEKHDVGSFDMAVATAIKGNDTHRSKVEILKSRYRGTKDNYKAAQALQAKMESSDKLDDAEILDALKQATKFEREMREGSVRCVVQSIHKVIDTRIDGIDQFCTQFQKDGSEPSMSYFQSQHEFLTNLVQTTSAPPSRWRESLQRCGDILPRIAAGKHLNDFRAEVVALGNAPDTIDIPHMKSLIKAGENITKSLVDGHPEVLSVRFQLNDVLNSILTWRPMSDKKDVFPNQDALTTVYTALMLLSKLYPVSSAQMSGVWLIGKACNLCKEMTALPDLKAADFTERVLSTSGKEILAKVVATAKGFDNDLLNVAPFLKMQGQGWVMKPREQANEMLENCKDTRIRARQQAWEQWASQCDFKKIIGGMTDGSSWKDGVPADTSLKGIVEAAKASLLKVKAKAFAELLDRGRELLNLWKDEIEFFDAVASDDASWSESAALTDKGFATKYEGILAAGYVQRSDNAAAMKKLIMEPRAEFSKHDGIAKHVHPAFLEMVDRAYKMRKLVDA